MKAVIVTYVVKKGCEREFLQVLRKHWKVLRSENLATEQNPFLLCDPENPSVYKEIFQWKSKRSFQKAHESLAVQRLWNRMKELTVDGGVELAHFLRK